MVSDTPEAVLSSGQLLLSDKPYLSTSGAHYLIGNGTELAIYETGSETPIWKLRLLDKTAARIEMHPYGLLAMRDRDGALIWETPIAEPVEGSYLDIDASGVAQILTPAVEALWRSDTLTDEVMLGVNYEVSQTLSDTSVFDNEDGSSIAVETTIAAKYVVKYTPPASPPAAEEVIPFGPNGEIGEDAIAAAAAAEAAEPDTETRPKKAATVETAPTQDQALAGEPVTLPELSVLLTYSIGDQVRGAQGAAPDYFVAVDAEGFGVITEGAGAKLVALQGGTRVAFMLADGPMKDKVLLGHPDGASSAISRTRTSSKSAPRLSQWRAVSPVLNPRLIPVTSCATKASG